MSKPVLSDDALTDAMAGLAGWTLADDQKSIEKSFKFGNFKTAYAFMTHGALCAETLDHHPEWFNVCNRVEVKLTTHDSGGVTELDISLAKSLNEAAS